MIISLDVDDDDDDDEFLQSLVASLSLNTPI
jgi:hypothetical protein